MMPHTKDEERLSILQLNEESGEIKVFTPKYTPDEELTFGTLLILALAHRIANDVKWCEGVVTDAEKEMAKAVKH